MKYHFKIHKEKGGFWAECIEIPSCMTQGDSLEDLEDNMQDAIHTYLEEPQESNFLAPLPKKSIKIGRNVVDVPVDPSIALAFSLRRERIKRGLTQQEAAEKLGMKGTYSYQRLEKRCNPTLEMIFRIVSLFPTLSLDRILR